MEEMEEINEVDAQEALGTLNQSIDKETARKVLIAIQDAARRIADDFNLRVVLNAGRYSPTMVKTTVELQVRMHNGKTPAQILFEKHAQHLDYKVSWFGRKVKLGRCPYIISGVMPRRSKNCIQLTRETDGKKFKCTVKRIREALGE